MFLFYNLDYVYKCNDCGNEFIHDIVNNPSCPNCGSSNVSC
jgi:DNA-directed RNA polymerase subunit RPC12/RpoP